MNKEIRKIIEIDEKLCNGCGECVPSCAEGALEIIDGKARVIADRYCDGLGACLGECPTGALTIVERSADAFDEEAVEELLQSKRPQQAAQGGCPSARVQSLSTPCEQANAPSGQEGKPLTNWPVQISLVPPTAPFLQNADLLVAADCAPPAFPRFHSDLLPGKVLLLGCPKFDDRQAYIDKFVQIFQNNTIKSVTVLVMEVPCCQGLPQMVHQARQTAGVDVPVSVVIAGRDGTLKEHPMGRPDPKLTAMMPG